LGGDFSGETGGGGNVNSFSSELDDAFEAVRFLESELPRLGAEIYELRGYIEAGLVFMEAETNGVVDLASGITGGTEFRIILKTGISDEETASFATTGGFDQLGFYRLGMLHDVFHRLLELTQEEDQPSVNLIQERSQEPLKAVVLNTIAGRSKFYRKHFGEGLWRDYYYSMHYAAIELLATNFYSRIHIGSIAESQYEPEELRCIIEAFIHYARQSDHANLELVVGGPAYFNYHVNGGHAYLDYIEEFVQDALKGSYTRVPTTESKEYGRHISGEDVQRFDLQRRIVHVPIKT